MNKIIAEQNESLRKDLIKATVSFFISIVLILADNTKDLSIVHSKSIVYQ